MDKLGEIELLFRENFSSMYKAASHLIKDDNVAKSIVQDVFYQFWKSKEKVEANTSMRSLLIKATVTLCLNYLKSNSDLVNKDEVQKNSPINSSQILSSNVNSKIENAVFELPPNCQSVFMMSEYGGMDHQDIANTMGISIKTVENQISIALKKLKGDISPNFKLGFINLSLTIMIFSMSF